MQLEHILNQHIEPHSTHILAISGGPDSIYLLHRLMKIKKHTDFTLILGHVNYHLRGKESLRDEHSVRKVAQTYKLDLEIKHAKLRKKNRNLEEKARIIRYAWLEKLRIKHKAAYVLTGHNLNDNLETILLNFTRGCGLEGLKGMNMVSNHIFRPLLLTPKNEIISWLKKNKVPYCQDSTNQKVDFSRNRIRLKVIPELKKINPQLENTFISNHEIIKDIHTFMQKQAQDWIDKNTYFSVEAFNTLPTALKREIIACLYKKKYQSTRGLSFKIIQRCLKLIQQAKTGKKTRFGTSSWLEIEYGKWKIEKNTSDHKPYKLIIEILNSALRSPLRALRSSLLVDTSKINPKNLRLRTWKKGDRLQPLGLKGTKKLQDIFTDKKIRAQKRKHIPIVVNEKDEIIGLPTLRIVSEKYKVTKKTQKIVRVRIKKI